jgi:elongation factor P
MIPVTQLRSGATFEEQGEPWRVIEYKHTHLSRGSGTIKVKCRNLRNGQVLLKTFKSGDRIEDIAIERKQLQYLYSDGSEYFFMDPVSYEQLTLAAVVLGDQAKYLKEGELVYVLYWDEKPLDIDLPMKMTFMIAEAAPGERGDSASNMYKDAVLENGHKIRVPLFVNAGEAVRVDTRTGEYVERA